MKLSKTQQAQLNGLRSNGKLFIGYSSRPIMNIFDKLVAKGMASVIEVNSYGKRYAAIERSAQ